MHVHCSWLSLSRMIITLELHSSCTKFLTHPTDQTDHRAGSQLKLATYDIIMDIACFLQELVNIIEDYYELLYSIILPHYKLRILRKVLDGADTDLTHPGWDPQFSP